MAAKRSAARCGTPPTSRPTDLLWAAFTTSPYAHAKIVRIDTTAAKAVPGRARGAHLGRHRTREALGPDALRLARAGLRQGDHDRRSRRRRRGRNARSGRRSRAPRRGRVRRAARGPRPVRRLGARRAGHPSRTRDLSLPRQDAAEDRAPQPAGLLPVSQAATRTSTPSSPARRTSSSTAFAPRASTPATSSRTRRSCGSTATARCTSRRRTKRPIALAALSRATSPACRPRRSSSNRRRSAATSAARADDRRVPVLLPGQRRPAGRSSASRPTPTSSNRTRVKHAAYITLQDRRRRATERSSRTARRHLRRRRVRGRQAVALPDARARPATRPCRIGPATSRSTAQCVYTNTAPGTHVRAPARRAAVLRVGAARRSDGRRRWASIRSSCACATSCATGRLTLTGERRPSSDGRPPSWNASAPRSRRARRRPAAPGAVFAGCRHTGGGKTSLDATLQPDGTIDVLSGVPDQGGGGHTVVQRVIAATLWIAPERIRLRRGSTREAPPIRAPAAAA